MTLKDALQQAESNDFKPFKLNQKAKLVAKYKTQKGAAYNVAGYIEGSDPKLKEEAVLFSAHYDAYGKEDDKIYFGAADNALRHGRNACGRRSLFENETETLDAFRRRHGRRIRSLRLEILGEKTDLGY